jgi:hypothetical protein
VLLLAYLVPTLSSLSMYVVVRIINRQYMRRKKGRIRASSISIIIQDPIWKEEHPWTFALSCITKGNKL